MKKLALAASALAFSAGMALASDVVRLGTEGAYAPWNFINDAGEIDGFERDLGDELCKRADLKCEWVKNDWDSIIPNLVSGNYDAIIAGMSITEERKEQIDFTTNYTPPDPSNYLAKSADVDVTAGVIAAQTNTIQAGFVADQGWELIEFATPEETVAAVRNGEADAVLADQSFLQAVAAEDSSLVMLERQEVIGAGVGMGLRKSDAGLRETFNAAIDSMKEDGSLNELITKWDVASTF